MNITEFKHYDTNEGYISLHDCVVTRVNIEDNRMFLCFDDGFWVLTEHPENDTDKIVKTSYSNLGFDLEESEDSIVYIFEKGLFGRTHRRECALSDLISRINRGTFQLEILYCYSDRNVRMIECVLRNNKKYYRECVIKIALSNISFCWNELRKEIMW